MLFIIEVPFETVIQVGRRSRSHALDKLSVDILLVHMILSVLRLNKLQKMKVIRIFLYQKK